MESNTVPPSSAASTTVADLLPTAAAAYGERVALRHQVGGDWRDVSFREAGEIVSELGRGLIDLGVGPGQRVAILAITRPEWSYVDFATMAAGGVVVPVYPTSSAEDCAWVLSDSETVVVVCADDEQLAKVVAVRDRLPALHTLVVMDAAAAGDGVLSLDEVRERGRGRDAGELESRTHAVGAQDIATMVYTSGTTGPPKGCILTHANVRAAAAGIEEHKFVDGADDLVYLFLPLAHVFARIIQFVAFEEGTPTAYWGGDRDRIIVEVATLKPTLVPSIPRLFEKFYTLIAAHNPKDVVQRATDVGVRVRQLERAGEPVPDDLREEFETFETSLFANVRAAFGGRLNYAVCGGAPLGTDILRFFWACGTPILEDYGLTETMAVISLSTMRDVKLGAVGKPITGMQVRIAPDGELLARGPNVFQGYHGDAQATAAVLVDGWLQTGDLARVDDDGFLEITGRKKDIIITAGGKNITPTNLENDLRQSRWISQAVMYGDRRPYPVALVTLDEEQILPWAREQGLPDEIGTLSRDARVRELVQADLELANGRYGTVEQVKRFAILDRDLTQETGELTPTLKVKRAVVYDKYADLFTELYGEGT